MEVGDSLAGCVTSKPEISTAAVELDMGRLACGTNKIHGSAMLAENAHRDWHDRLPVGAILPSRHWTSRNRSESLSSHQEIARRHSTSQGTANRLACVKCKLQRLSSVSAYRQFCVYLGDALGDVRKGDF